MAWDFSTDPEFQEKLDWVEQFCKEKVEPLDYVFPYAIRSPDPVVKAYVRELQQDIERLRAREEARESSPDDHFGWW